MGTQGVPLNIPKSLICEAIKKWNGKATLLARDLKCSYAAIKRIIDKDPELVQLMNDARIDKDNLLNDLAEDALQHCLEQVKDDRTNALKSAMYVLNSKGAERNYYAPNTPDKHTDGRYTAEDINTAVNDGH